MEDFLPHVRAVCRIAWLLGIVLHAHPVLACPTCKDSLTENYVQAYGMSIIFMMSMPFLIFGGLSAYFYWEVCRARKRQRAENAADAPGDEHWPVASG